MTTDSEPYVEQFDYGTGTRVGDSTVELYEMTRMMAGDAVARAKKMYADEHDVRFSKLVGRKLYRRAERHRENRTYVVAEKGDLR